MTQSRSHLTRAFAGTEFARSSRCGPDHNCTYVRRDLAALGDSKSGDVLALSPGALRALVSGVRD